MVTCLRHHLQPPRSPTCHGKQDAAGSAATFFFFCGASVVCFCLILCLVRETKGVTVGAVDPEADSLLDKANN